MRREIRNLFIGCGVVSLGLTLAQCVIPSYRTCLSAGYVPKDVSNCQSWSTETLREELFLINERPGNDKMGLANYTLSQREAYGRIFSELRRRDSD